MEALEYTGLIDLHPHDPNVVYIAADVDPVTGEPLTVDGEQRYEIFRGRTDDRGRTWEWEAITENSPKDNIRPIVVSDSDRTVVIWLRGEYESFTTYDLEVRGVVE